MAGHEQRPHLTLAVFPLQLPGHLSKRSFNDDLLDCKNHTDTLSRISTSHTPKRLDYWQGPVFMNRDHISVVCLFSGKGKPMGKPKQRREIMVFIPTPVALESTAIVAFGHAKDDVIRAAEAFRESYAPFPHAFLTLCETLDRLKALGWVP